MNGTYAVIAGLYRVHAAQAFRKATNKLAPDDGGSTGAPQPGMYADFQIEAVNLPAAPFALPYRGLNARSSSRAASLKSLSGSITAPLFIRSCSSRTVLFSAKMALIVASMSFSADATIRIEDGTRMSLVMTKRATSSGICGSLLESGAVSPEQVSMIRI
jgi:hypothetical protein